MRRRQPAPALPFFFPLLPPSPIRFRATPTLDCLSPLNSLQLHHHLPSASIPIHSLRCLSRHGLVASPSPIPSSSLHVCLAPAAVFTSPLEARRRTCSLSRCVCFIPPTLRDRARNAVVLFARPLTVHLSGRAPCCRQLCWTLSLPAVSTTSPSPNHQLCFRIQGNTACALSP